MPSQETTKSFKNCFFFSFSLRTGVQRKLRSPTQYFSHGLNLFNWPGTLWDVCSSVSCVIQLCILVTFSNLVGSHRQARCNEVLPELVIYQQWRHIVFFASDNRHAWEGMQVKICKTHEDSQVYFSEWLFILRHRTVSHTWWKGDSMWNSMQFQLPRGNSVFWTRFLLAIIIELKVNFM